MEGLERLDPPPLNPNPLLAAHRRHGSLARPRCDRPLAPVCPSPHTYRSARLPVRQLAVGPLVGLSHHSIMYRMCGAMPSRHLRPAMTRHGGGAKPPRIHPKVSHPRHPTRLPGCPNASTCPHRPHTRHLSDSKIRLRSHAGSTGLRLLLRWPCPCTLPCRVNDVPRRPVLVLHRGCVRHRVTPCCARAVWLLSWLLCRAAP